MKIIELLIADMARNGIYPQNNGTEFKVLAGEIKRFPLEGYDHDDPMGWFMFDHCFGLCVYGIEGRTQYYSYIKDPMKHQYNEDEIKRFIKNEVRVENEKYKKTEAYKSRTKRFNFQFNWNHSLPINDQHQILRKIGIKSCGLREFNGELIAPIYNRLEEIAGMLYFLPSGAYLCKAYPLPTDARSYMGDINAHTEVALCEDQLTGAMVREITGLPVVVYHAPKNLPEVAADIHSEYPDHSLYICPNHNSESIAAAEKASALCSGEPLIPEKMKSRPNTSFYDRVRKFGPGAITIPLEEARSKRRENCSEGTYYGK